MSAPVPPHYRSFRLLLALTLIAALAAATWYLTQPEVLPTILHYLGG